MQTTLELHDQLLAQAMKYSGETTEQGTVEAGLRLLVQISPRSAAPGEVPNGFRRLGTSRYTRDEAAEGIRQIAEKHTLGGLRIKDLIEEGRR